jgi:hypothetical protein
MIDCEKCPEGRACCGIVPIKEDVWEKHKDKVKEKISIHKVDNLVFPLLEGSLKCCFLNDEGKCLIYEDRPEVCREYGMTDRLPCPFFKPNGNPRSEARKKQILRKVDKDVDKVIKKMEGR